MNQRQVHVSDSVGDVLKQLAGAELSLLQETRGCFDITPQRVPETEFEAARRELDELQEMAKGRGTPRLLLVSLDDMYRV